MTRRQIEMIVTVIACLVLMVILDVWGKVPSK